MEWKLIVRKSKTQAKIEGYDSSLNFINTDLIGPKINQSEIAQKTSKLLYRLQAQGRYICLSPPRARKSEMQSMGRHHVNS
jgi:hypothetical protein